MSKQIARYNDDKSCIEFTPRGCMYFVNTLKMPLAIQNEHGVTIVVPEGGYIESDSSFYNDCENLQKYAELPIISKKVFNKTPIIPKKYTEDKLLKLKDADLRKLAKSLNIEIYPEYVKEDIVTKILRIEGQTNGTSTNKR